MSKYDLDLFTLKAELCKTFSDPRRLMIMEELRHGEKMVGDIADALGVAPAAASRHLAVLRDRGVVNTRREGTSVFYSLADDRIGEACQMVHDVLIGQMERNRALAEKVMRL